MILLGPARTLDCRLLLSERYQAVRTNSVLSDKLAVHSFSSKIYVDDNKLYITFPVQQCASSASSDPGFTSTEVGSDRFLTSTELSWNNQLSYRVT